MPRRASWSRGHQEAGQHPRWRRPPRSGPPNAGQRHRTATPTKTLDRNGNSHVGYSYLHNAVDDHSRLAYSEILADERKETAVAFWQRAQLFFVQAGITVQRVLNDNGSCYKSRLWHDTLTAAGITHNAPSPTGHRPTASIERYHRILAEEFLYARTWTSEQQRSAALAIWNIHYNYHRGHTALNGHPPASRIFNLTGQST